MIVFPEKFLRILNEEELFLFMHIITSCGFNETRVELDYRQIRQMTNYRQDRINRVVYSLVNKRVLQVSRIKSEYSEGPFVFQYRRQNYMPLLFDEPQMVFNVSVGDKMIYETTLPESMQPKFDEPC